MAPRRKRHGEEDTSSSSKHGKKQKSTSGEAMNAASSSCSLPITTNSRTKHLKSVQTEDFQCVICSEVMEGPVTLGCAHSYCNHCLQKLAASARSDDYDNEDDIVMPCPSCRRHFSEIPPVNLALARLIDKAIEGDQAELDRRLDIAVLGGRTSRVQALLTMGANPNATSSHPNGEGETVNRVLWASLFMDFEDCCPYGIRMDDFAEACGNIAILLSEAGATATRADMLNACHALHVRSFQKVVRMLLDLGMPADNAGTQKASFLERAVNCAEDWKRTPGADSKKLEDLCIRLLKAGADVNPPNGFDLVAAAAHAGYHKLVGKLIDKGAKVHRNNRDVAYSMLQVWADAHPKQLRKE